MKKLSVIITAILIVGSTLGQTFESFKGIVNFKKSSPSERESFLLSKGYVNTGSGSFKSKEATDTICAVWLSADSMEIIKVNTESVEYEWLYGNRYFNVQVNKLFDSYSTDISTAMFDTKRKYLFVKKTRGVRCSNYDKHYSKSYRPYDYSYIKRDNLYIRSKLWFNHIFVGDINE